MGEVYRARDPRLQRDVAIKILPTSLTFDPDRRRRFETEAHAVAALADPHVLAVYDVGSADGTAYLVTELLEGVTLKEQLGSGPVGTKRALDWAEQIARGLAAAHDKGIVHRDLKPANVFVTRGGRVKILDFGLAKRSPTPNSPDGETATADTDSGTLPGQVLGTAGYMSPEQVRGERADARSDLFALGAVLYEMLTGRRAFAGETRAESMAAILRDEPPDLGTLPPTLPPLLPPVLRRCLAKEPSQRFHSAHDLVFALQAVQGSTPTPAEESRKKGRRRAVTTLIGVAVAAVGLLVGFLWPRDKEPPLYRRLTFRRGRVEAARFTPDGQGVIYAATFDAQPLEVFEMRLDGREARSRGLKGATLLAVSSRGEMALQLGPADRTGALASLSEGTLARMPLGAELPRPVLDNVRSADWSPDGQELAAVVVVPSSPPTPELPTQPSLEGLRIEFPLGRVVYKAGPSVEIVQVRVSPRGDQVAFTEMDLSDRFVGGEERVVVVDRQGRTQIVSRGWAKAWGLAWSPQGEEVWFTAAKPGSHKNLYAASLSGHLRLLARVSGEMDLQDVSRDGRVLFEHPTLRQDLYVHSLADGTTRELTWLGNSRLVGLSESGERVLFNDGQAGGQGDSFFVRGIDGSAAIKLGDGLAVALSGDGRFAVAHDSNGQQFRLVPTEAGSEQALDPGNPALGYCSFIAENTLTCTPDAGPRAPRTFRQHGRGAPWKEVTGQETPAATGEPTSALAAGSPFDNQELQFLERKGCDWMGPSRGGRYVNCVTLDSGRGRLSRLERRTGRDTVAAEWTAYPPEGVLFGELALLSSIE